MQVEEETCLHSVLMFLGSCIQRLSATLFCLGFFTTIFAPKTCDTQKTSAFYLPSHSTYLMLFGMRSGRVSAINFVCVSGFFELNCLKSCFFAFFPGIFCGKTPLMQQNWPFIGPVLSLTQYLLAKWMRIFSFNKL